MDSKHYPGRRYLLVQADVAGGAYMHPMPFRGAWVRWEDYAALEAEWNRLRAALDERCVCEEGHRCGFCAVLEEGGDG